MKSTMNHVIQIKKVLLIIIKQNNALKEQIVVKTKGSNFLKSLISFVAKNKTKLLAERKVQS